MNKYMVYFTVKASKNRQKLQDIIFGYSEDDALVRYGIKRSEITHIGQQFT